MWKESRHMRLRRIRHLLSVPPEILRLIFSYLSEDLGRAAQVCHRWKDNAYDVIQLKDKEALKKYGAFGAAEWAEYFGER